MCGLGSISAGCGKKKCKKIRKKVEKSRKSTVKEARNRELNEDSWLIEECKIGWVQDNID